MSDLVGNCKDRFSYDAACMITCMFLLAIKEIGSKTPLILKQNPKLTTPRLTPGSHRVTEKVQQVLPMNRQVRGPPVDLSKAKQVYYPDHDNAFLRITNKGSPLAQLV